MQIEVFLDKVKSGERVAFEDTMAVIAANYQYIPTRFVNGTVVNEAGSNEGSCKIFYFAKLHRLTPEQTLSLFGDYYWKDVLDNPEAADHANIRAFLKQAWAGVAYDGDALIAKPV